MIPLRRVYKIHGGEEEEQRPGTVVNITPTRSRYPFRQLTTGPGRVRTMVRLSQEQPLRLPRG